ncbi:helix-turn-helix transcriptional regulator [Streptomyces griseorubiginosus]|uniref:helix-turn-helix transcriptional regulator n=1 Tax=Streptomyces griseorubiginosus TaxID=67304 RepID=UPI001AD73F53|nr:YafY family protein [Streptomyces griseorubiginosus]MBO4255696.1 WYL domain-containing protein [Streptomyces griseorubiginosus]
MKAGRLVSILLLLQTRGRMTAAQLAEELEVSVRTVYRDVEALSAAGVPLYGDAGHAGGYRLLEGYRTRLTGLTTEEAEALFLAGAPGPAAELGLGSVLAAAQLKVRAALPPELRVHADRISGRFHLDAPGWYADAEETPYLPAVAEAVWNGRVLRVLYRRWAEPTDVRRRLEPYGLVLKAGRWYVVAGPGPRTFRVDQILELSSSDEEFTRPADFDLAAYWSAYQRDFHDRLYRGEAVVRLAPGVSLPRAVVLRTDADGRTVVRVPIESVGHAHGEFLRLGADVEVLEPADLRTRLARTIAELAGIYGNVT